MNNNSSSTNDDLFRLVVIGGALVISCAILPVLFFSGIGAYFLYWGWCIEPDQGVIRKSVKAICIHLTFLTVVALVVTLVLSFYNQQLLEVYNLLQKKHPLSIKKFEVFATNALLIGSAVGAPVLAGIMRLFKFEPNPRVFGISALGLHLISIPVVVLYGAAFQLVSIFAAFVPLILSAAIYYILLDILGKSYGSMEMANLAGFSLLAWSLYGAIWYFREENSLKDSSNGVLYNSHSEGLVIGKLQNRRTMSLNWSDLNHHIHVLGQPGSGKSTLLKNFYSYSILNGMGFMMVDLKADLDVRSEILSLAKQASRDEDLKILDFSNPDQSTGYNPLLRGNHSELRDRIIESFEWSEIYYKKVAESFVLNVMKGFVILRDEIGVVPTLADLLEVISHPVSLKILAEKLPEGHEEAKEDLLDLAAELKKGSLKESLSGLKADLEALLKSDFGELFTLRKSIDVFEVIKSGQILYVLLDGQTYPVQSQRIGRMLLADLRSASGRIVSQILKDERPQFSVIIDEFSDLVSTKDMGRQFTGFLNRCRGSGIGVTIAHQSLGDFEDPQVARQVIDSTNTVISFVQKDPESCETLAGIVGTRDVWEKTEQTEQFFVFGDTETGRGSKVKGQEYVFHPNDFKNLNIGEAIFAAKKPTRYGRVFVRNLQIEVNNDLVFNPSLQDNCEFVDLKKERRTLFTMRSQSEKGKVSPKEKEVPLDSLT